MKEYLYIDDQGQQIGPISEHELKYLKASGIINNETYVWTEGMPDWLPFDKAFPEAAGGSAPQTPPPLPSTPVISTSLGEAFKRSLKSLISTLKNKKEIRVISIAALACVAIIGVLLSLFMGGGMTKEEAYEELRKYGIVNSLLHLEGPVGQRALYKAAEQGNLKIVQLLIAGGVPVNGTFEGKTALNAAVSAEKIHEEIVRFLINVPGIDVNASEDYDEDGYIYSPLARAAWKGHIEIVKLLLDAPGIDVYKTSALEAAAGNGHTEVVKLLLAAPGVDVNKADLSDRTPLCWAAEKGHTEVVRLLLAAPGVDVNKADSNDRTPLCWAAEKGHTEVVRLLLSAGADVNREGKYGNTPLRYAAEKGHTEVVRLLLAAPGIDVNTADWNERTPLYWAAREGHTEIVELLQAAGARK